MPARSVQPAFYTESNVGAKAPGMWDADHGACVSTNNVLVVSAVVFAHYDHKKPLVRDFNAHSVDFWLCCLIAWTLVLSV